MASVSRKVQNYQRILESIYVYGPVSRIDIAHQTGITPATVTELTTKMLLGHDIAEVGQATPSVGRPKILLRVDSGSQVYIGCELMPQAFSFVMINGKGTIIDRYSETFKHEFDSDEATVPNLVRALKRFVQRNHSKNIAAIGMSVPGHYDKETANLASSDSLWKTFNFAELNQATTLPIYYENNVHAMAITERLFNSHQKDETFIFFHVAHGLFCSTIYHGRPYGSKNPLVGEVADMVVNTEGEPRDDGRRGCLETYASEYWIMRKARLLYSQADNTFLRQMANSAESLTFDQVLQAYDLGDEGVMRILTNAVQYLAVAVTNFTLLIDAKRIVLHGKIFEKPALFRQLKEYLKANQSMFATVAPIRIMVKPVSPYDGAYGAAGMALCKSKLGFD